MRGGEIILSNEDVIAIKKLVDEADVVGTRYLEDFMQDMGGNCIPFSEWKSWEHSLSHLLSITV